MHSDIIQLSPTVNRIHTCNQALLCIKRCEVTNKSINAFLRIRLWWRWRRRTITPREIDEFFNTQWRPLLAFDSFLVEDLCNGAKKILKNGKKSISFAIDHRFSFHTLNAHYPTHIRHLFVYRNRQMPVQKIKIKCDENKQGKHTTDYGDEENEEQKWRKNKSRTNGSTTFEWVCVWVCVLCSVTIRNNSMTRFRVFFVVVVVGGCCCMLRSIAIRNRVPNHRNPNPIVMRFLSVLSNSILCAILFVQFYLKCRAYCLIFRSSSLRTHIVCVKEHLA